eukprot:CAMPEP_0171957424 /NCGR_PEP_ID=MMETSP0993-20121228/131252_1 /TAXON_ID=483369 /ORGANISM="non described non described, Strain CCMP2098" /LENGTH=42 /DNA_ID= /DNA_START= /DNA_END= /DNA_ORIENTATION=
MASKDATKVVQRAKQEEEDEERDPAAATSTIVVEVNSFLAKR